MSEPIKPPEDTGKPKRLKELFSWMEGVFAEAGFRDPKKEALFLASGIIGFSPSEALLKTEDELTEDLVTRLIKAAGRRVAREPYQYITGSQEFYGLEFLVSPDVFIPRPETELLVDETLAVLRGRSGESEPLRVLELCTGSGAVSVTLATILKDATFVATDISPGALTVAKENALRHGVSDRIEFLEGDLFGALGGREDLKGFSHIVANPPYILSGEVATLEPEVKSFEPHVALDGGEDGLVKYRDIVRLAPEYMQPRTTLLLEVGYNIADAVIELIDESGRFTRAVAFTDLSGIERVIRADLR